MSEFVISFPDLELDRKQSAQFQRAIQEAARKELVPIVASAKEILKDFPPGVPPPTGGHNPGRGTPSPAPGGPGPAQPPSDPIYSPGRPIGKGPLPIVYPVSYTPESRTWTVALP